MRFCNCTGYLSNPGGVCCKDLYKPIPPEYKNLDYINPININMNQLTEEELVALRELIKDRQSKSIEEDLLVASVTFAHDNIRNCWTLEIFYNNGTTTKHHFYYIEDLLVELEDLDYVS